MGLIKSEIVRKFYKCLNLENPNTNKSVDLVFLRHPLICIYIANCIYFMYYVCTIANFMCYY